MSECWWFNADQYPDNDWEINKMLPKQINSQCLDKHLCSNLYPVLNPGQVSEANKTSLMKRKCYEEKNNLSHIGEFIRRDVSRQDKILW